jgi:hypothetical protein
MNIDVQKVIAMCCLTVCFCVALAFEKPEAWGGVLALMGLVLGGGTAVKNAIKHILRIQ